MWVARDSDGELALFEKKPHRCNHPRWEVESWYSLSGNFIDLDPKLFPYLTWNDEPIEVELLRKK